MRVLAFGGTAYNDPGQLHLVLRKINLWRPIEVLIEGEAAGADSMARDWAQLMGIPVEPYHAEWTLLGNAAGSIRNSRMLREGRPDFGVGFPGSRGTADMLRKLIRAKVPGIMGRWSQGPNSQIIWRRF